MPSSCASTAGASAASAPTASGATADSWRLGNGLCSTFHTQTAPKPPHLSGVLDCRVPRLLRPRPYGPSHPSSIVM